MALELRSVALELRSMALDGARMVLKRRFHVAQASKGVFKAKK